jgi:hypothetical protein
LAADAGFGDFRLILAWKAGFTDMDSKGADFAGGVTAPGSVGSLEPAAGYAPACAAWKNLAAIAECDDSKLGGFL